MAGRQKKGDRVAISCRVEREYARLYAEQAAAAGIPLGDYVALHMAQLHHLPVPAYIRQAQRDSQLQMEVIDRKSA